MSGASCAGYGVNNTAAVLVLYILLVIILMTFAF
ncbi:sporulation protein YjcZ [Paenibacillus sp. LMG 31458]|uniref:Sporulation protein YjcZ n=1 Tax=Paenibacillus phytorum TaxID=2654977 RepID=A0ABX1XYX2_9BACL|nr:sporulation protein YjcZ [Paenibacillus phytorum]